MPSTTKKLIFETFLSLLEKMPFDKITVRDIVETANINRNTFYYYYCDIYELLEEIFKNEYCEILANHTNSSRWAFGFKNLLETAYSNKKIINNICASKSYNYLESYMFRSSKSILFDYISELSECYNISEKNLEFLVSFYQYAIMGTLSDWFITGMSETPKELLIKIGSVLTGIRPAIEQMSKRKQ